MIKGIRQFISAKSFLIIGVIFIVAHLALKINYIKFFTLGGDEPFMIFYCQQSTSELLKFIYNSGETNPPLAFLLIHFWIKLFGTGIVALKVLPILVSIVTSLYVVKIGKLLNHIWIPISTLTLFLFSDLHLEISQEIKTFGLTLMFATISFYYFIAYLKLGKWHFLLMVILANIALPYTHYNSALVPFIQFLTCFMFIKNHKKKVVKLIIGNIISALFFLPQLWVLINTIPDEGFWLKKATFNDYKYVLFKIVGNDKITEWFLYLFLLSPILLIIFKKRKWLNDNFSSKWFLMFWFWFFIAITTNYLVGIVVPAFRLKYVYFSSIAIYIGLSYLFFNLRVHFLIKTGIYILVASHFYINLNKTPSYSENWKNVSKRVKKESGNSTLIGVSPGYKYKDLLYEYDREKFNNYNNTAVTFKQLNLAPIWTIEDTTRVFNDTSNKFIFIKSISNENINYDPIFSQKYILVKTWKNASGINVNTYYRKNSKQTKLTIIKTDTVQFSQAYKWERKVLKNLNELVYEEYKLLLDTESLSINTSNQFGPTINISPNNYQNIEVSSYTLDRPTLGELVISTELKGETIDRYSYNLNDFSNNENELIFNHNLNKNYATNCKTKIYFWNPNDKSVDITGLKIKLLRR